MISRKIRIRGIVQGVGFRPFIYNLAEKFGLRGQVLNDTEGVLVWVEGPRDRVGGFIDSIEREKPRPSVIEEIIVEDSEPRNSGDFRIVPSALADGDVTAISPDLATCDKCLAEMHDPENRRFEYPFINCTHCGPRYSIIEDLPYDRPNTTMREFLMCADCENEYTDISDRRFHAQPNACDVCGPEYSLFDSHENQIVCDDPIRFAAKKIQNGAIVAVKGIAGFHLIANPLHNRPIESLRQSKNRPNKPFALMFSDINSVKKFCYISDAEIEYLKSPAALILLLEMNQNYLSTFPENLAPGLNQVGVFLPYAPVHHLLFKNLDLPAIIATSGNRRDEPIAMSNREAFDNLSNIADFFLVHNRKIIGRSDDSVGFVFRDRLILNRRSRGFVPRSIELPFRGQSVLAVGADLKSTFVLTRGNKAYLSPYLGDLSGPVSLEFFREVLDRYLHWLKIEPKTIICDLHPDYVSTAFAENYSREFEIPLSRIQHHYAHGLSVMAEHKNPNQPALSISMDGHGYGDDSTIWGGEFLIVDYSGYHRAAHIKTVPQPGGDLAAREPARMALSWGYEAFGEKVTAEFPAIEKDLGEAYPQLLSMIQKKRSPLTSSAGRLFDTAAYLAGVYKYNSYEGECPIKLMSLFDSNIKESYPMDIRDQILDPTEAIRQIIRDRKSNIAASTISSKFHRGLARAIVQMAKKICTENQLKTVLLSGGVFQNSVLLRLVVEGLEKAGLKPFWNMQNPPGDAGVALGQALYAINSATQD